MHLAEIARDLEEKLAEARQIAEQIPLLEERLTVVRDLLAMYSENGGVHLPPEPEPEDWSDLPRRRAVLRALQESREPLSPSDIGRVLERHGRSGDDHNYISAALASLKKAGKVYSPAFAQWTTSDREPPGDPRITDLVAATRRG